MYAIVDLHGNAPGTNLSASQQVMADQDHAIAYWTSVANTFKNDPAIIFEPYNEPDISTSNAITTNPWDCWLHGCTITQFTPTEKAPPVPLQWQSAGMQTLVNTIRSTGAANVISLSGLRFSSDLSQLLQYLPVDPLHQLTATFHNYGTNATQNGGCGPSCWDSTIAPIAQKMPVITDEMGEPNCQTTYVTQYMNWADQHNISYLPWIWTNWTCQKYAYGLLADWNGTPNSYGKVFYDHFQAINPVSSITPQPSIAQSPTPSVTISPQPSTTVIPTPTQQQVPSPTISPQISYHVSGKQILDQNDTVYIPYGVNVGGLMFKNWQTNPVQKTLEANISEEIVAAKNIWKSNVVRIQIAPSLLFAQTPYDNTYLSHVDADVNLATTNGLNIIISLQTETTTNEPFPQQSSVTFWNLIAMRYKNNPRVFFDIFNEPRLWTGNITQSWDIWQHGGTYNGTPYVGMQDLVKAVRNTGAINLIFAEGLGGGESLQGLVNGEGTTPHLLTGTNIVYTIHPYFGTQHTTQTQWDAWFGNATRSLNAPVVADEWNMIDRSSLGCIPGIQEPAQVQPFLNYLHSLTIGLVAWHLSPGGLIRGDGNLNNVWDFSKPTKFDQGNPPALTCPNTWTFPDADPAIQAAGEEILHYFQQYSTSVTPSPTQGVSITPMPTPNVRDTLLGITVGLHGITMGDNVNSSGTGNITATHVHPDHQIRPVHIVITTITGTNPRNIEGTISWHAPEFTGTINAGALPPGDYFIKIKVDGFLARSIPITIHLTPGQINQIPHVALVTGDIINDNQVDILDYNALVNCFGSKQTSSTCTTPPTTSESGSDIDDTGTVDGVDYNLLLREFSVQPGQ